MKAARCLGWSGLLASPPQPLGHSALRPPLPPSETALVAAEGIRPRRAAPYPTPAQRRALASHCGGARLAYNWGRNLVQVCLQQRRVGQDVEVPWTLPALRREWNRAKHEVAPWWAQNSKEAYSSGLDGLARALRNWSDSRNGRRTGRPVGFPRAKKKGRARDACRFTVHPPGRSRCWPIASTSSCPGSGSSRPGELRRLLAYKTAWRGSRLLQAHPFFPSSKTCSDCGWVKAKLTLGERTFRCEACGLVIDRDLNAARNLAKLVEQVARSGRETRNARGADVGPGQAGLTAVKREAGTERRSGRTGTVGAQTPTARIAEPC